MVREREAEMAEYARISIDGPTKAVRRWPAIAVVTGLVIGSALMLIGSKGRLSHWEVSHDKGAIQSEHYIRDGELCGRVYVPQPGETNWEPAWLAEVTPTDGKRGPEIYMGGINRRDAEKWIESVCR
jgi:hypothetical protein